MLLVRGPALPTLPGMPALTSTLDHQIHHGIETTPPAVETSRTRVGGTGPSGGTGAGNGAGKDPAGLLILLAVVAALVLPLPSRARAAGALGRATALPRAIRPRGAGRCPTGPPLAA